jgi:sugar phosphate isomerase/epimerase
MIFGLGEHCNMVKISAMSQEFGERTVFKRGADKSIGEIVSRLADLGLDGIELECGSPRLPSWDIEKAKNIKEECDSHGLAITDLAAHQFFLMPGGGWQMEKEFLNLRACCEMANAIEAPYVRLQLVSWTFGSLPANVPLRNYAAEPGGSSLASQYSHGVQMIARSVKVAEEFGVTLGLDNHMFLPVMEHLHIANEIGSPNLKLFMDVRNCIEVGEDPIPTVRKCKGMLVHTHVKDARKEVGTSAMPLRLELSPNAQARAAAIRAYGGSMVGTFTIGVPVGMGNILNWEEWLKALKDINYKGYLSIEGAHVDPRFSPYEACSIAMKYLRNLSKKVGL